MARVKESVYCFNRFLNYKTITQGLIILCSELPDIYVMLYEFSHFKFTLKESRLKITSFFCQMFTFDKKSHSVFLHMGWIEH